MSEWLGEQSNLGIIAGASGGKGAAAHSSGSEEPDSLRSFQVAKLIDLVGEGLNVGIVGFMKGIYLDGVALQNADGTQNFKNTIVQEVKGLPAQPLIQGFESQQTENLPAPVRIVAATPATRTVDNLDTDRVRVTMGVLALQQISDDGDISGTSVQYEILVSQNGGAYASQGIFTIQGKTSSHYQRATNITLAKPGPWQVRVRRVTADSTSTKLQNDIYWEGLTEIIDARVNYTNSHCVGLIVDAEQFAQIPRRTYLVDGLKVRIPSNYDPRARTYSPAVWDGTFKTDWTENPAWVFYDLVTNNRYGLGSFLSAAGGYLVDKWALYQVGQFCDGRVPDGHGATEARFSCNAWINTQAQAFDLLASIASIFRGFAYWAGGALYAVTDQPRDTTGIFSHANVIDGRFSYAGADLKARHNHIAVTWHDPTNLGEQRLAVVEDQAAIARNGILHLDLPAIGCTRESEALRIGKWALYSENYESETVTFAVGLEAAWLNPGDVIGIADRAIAGTRHGGRVKSATTTTLTLDAALELTGAVGPTLSAVVGEGAIETRSITGHPSAAVVTVSPAFSSAPKPDSVWVVSSGDVETTTWRVVTVEEGDGAYQISALRYYAEKWDYVERGLIFAEPDISNINVRPPAVTNLKVVESLVALSAASIGVNALVSWTSSAPTFDVNARPDNGNWVRRRVLTTATEFQVTEGWWTFQVTPISQLGLKGPTSEIRYQVIGRLAPPAAPRQFRINVVDGVAMFDWLPAGELDVQIGGHFELRHSAATQGATWSTAQIVVPSIPGNATSVEAGYLPGTWFLRTFDSTGIASTAFATVIAMQPDTRYVQWVRICESPAWLGTRNNTQVLEPQRWLIIGATGGLWDDQATMMDSWPDIDVLPLAPDAPPPASFGTYNFYNYLDAGAPFSVRLAADVLAFPYADPDDFIDARLTNVDTWNDWDAVTADLDGEVIILIRSTLDDPLSSGAVWSAWKRFIAGEHFGRGFQFMAQLVASPGQNIGVETLCILGDFKTKIDEGGDVPYPAAQTRVYFRIKFFNVPAVVVTVQEAMATDQIRIVAKTRDYFDISITNGGVQQTRTFDWHAQGY